MAYRVNCIPDYMGSDVLILPLGGTVRADVSSSWPGAPALYICSFCSTVNHGGTMLFWVFAKVKTIGRLGLR